jgi:SAM-dependent methyltransferase
MSDTRAPDEFGFATHSNYVFAGQATERQRLENQSLLFREDFDWWFDQALRLGGLSSDPAEAHWSALDVGCGEGQFTRRIARRYPGARATGVDVNEAAIGIAAQKSRDLPNARFAVHDARDPLPGPEEGGEGFDVAVMWLVLLYLDRRGALANLASAIRPGGTLLLCNAPDESTRFSHPVVKELMAAVEEMARRFHLTGLEEGLGPDLQQAGFGDVRTVVLRYPLGSATVSGQRWWKQLLVTLAGTRPAVVDACGLMEGAEFDRRIELLAGESMLDHFGDWSFLVTLARRSAG